MAAIHIEEKNFHEEVIRSDKPVLVDFFATWCNPCRILGPIIDEIAEEREDVKVCKIDIDKEPALAARYGVVSIPTVLVFDNGDVVNKSVGAQPKAKLLSLLP